MMKKSDIQELYREIKKRPRHKPAQSHSRKQGCNTCGKVTWKPGR